MIISIGIEKALGKIHHPFWIKTFNRLNKGGTFLNIII